MRNTGGSDEEDPYVIDIGEPASKGKAVGVGHKEVISQWRVHGEGQKLKLKGVR